MFCEHYALIFREQMSSFCSKEITKWVKGIAKKEQRTKKKIHHVMIRADKSFPNKGLCQSVCLYV